MSIPSMCNLNAEAQPAALLTEADVDAAVADRLAWQAQFAPEEAESAVIYRPEWPQRRAAPPDEAPDFESFDPPGLLWICIVATTAAAMASVFWPHWVRP